MIIEGQMIEMKWSVLGKEHYESKGYVFTAYKEKFDVEAKDLMVNSKEVIRYTCDNCGVEDSKQARNLLIKEKHYCSLKCRNAKEPIKQREKKIASPYTYDPATKRYEKECQNCKSKYQVPSYRKDISNYCSESCRRLGMNKQVELNCKHCDKQFIRGLSGMKRNKSKQFFCSSACAASYKTEQSMETKECEYCNELFKSKKKYKQRFCSTKCQSEWQSIYLVGEKANNFNKSLPLNKRNTKCEWCGNSTKIKSPTKYRQITEQGKHIFCSTKCTKQWYSSVWSQSEEWREASRIRQTKFLSEGIFDHTDTAPQKVIDSILTEMNVSYINEYNCKYFAIDNYLIDHNLMIEVMGSYWHCDTRHYNDIAYKRQLKRIMNDRRKKAYIKEQYNINILYLWEEEIMNEPKLCKRLIQKYIENKGLLDNYHSFNFILKDDKVSLSSSITLPYMEMELEIVQSKVTERVKKSTSQKQLDKWITFNCEYCGKETEQLKVRYNKSKTHCCSRACSYARQKQM
ncbi:hypothetical protein BEH_07195 [Priestia filamentosa]|uniref:TRASH domain-containing protein n=1 Tax=Priestia filamentosa TaxID=1402861 RepID=A0A0H4KE47_9BACI|nr:hypothetical protein [Priestia filamentosa]AKO91905.1 hypothetical protein BEH_07195 [Priestia filamentosa]